MEMTQIIFYEGFVATNCSTFLLSLIFRLSIGVQLSTRLSYGPPFDGMYLNYRDDRAINGN